MKISLIKSAVALTLILSMTACSTGSVNQAETQDAVRQLNRVQTQPKQKQRKQSIMETAQTHLLWQRIWSLRTNGTRPLN